MPCFISWPTTVSCCQMAAFINLLCIFRNVKYWWLVHGYHWGAQDRDHQSVRTKFHLTISKPKPHKAFPSQAAFATFILLNHGNFQMMTEHLDSNKTRLTVRGSAFSARKFKANPINHENKTEVRYVKLTLFWASLSDHLLSFHSTRVSGTENKTKV